MAYELYYWDGIQGRGEFVRLALEEAGADYIDITRQLGRGTSAMIDVMESESEPHIPFAPPFLKDGDLIIPHVANILFSSVRSSALRLRTKAFAMSSTACN